MKWLLVNVSIVEKFGCHKRVELLRRTLGVRLRCARAMPFHSVARPMLGLRDISLRCSFRGKADSSRPSAKRIHEFTRLINKLGANRRMLSSLGRAYRGRPARSIPFGSRSRFEIAQADNIRGRRCTRSGRAGVAARRSRYRLEEAGPPAI